jgi:hypothetical protein
MVSAGGDGGKVGAWSSRFVGWGERRETRQSTALVQASDEFRCALPILREYLPHLTGRRLASASCRCLGLVYSPAPLIYPRPDAMYSQRDDLLPRVDSVTPRAFGVDRPRVLRTMLRYSRVRIVDPLALREGQLGQAALAHQIRGCRSHRFIGWIPWT